MPKCRWLLLASALLVLASCGPTLPPTTVPEPSDPSLQPFKAALEAYVNQTQPYRKQAAQAAEQVPGKAVPNVGAETAVRRRQNLLAEALQTKLRPSAKPGEIFGSAADDIRKRVSDAFTGPRRDLIIDGLAEQNEAGKATPQAVAVNEPTEAPRVPPQLLDVLPPLPAQLEYAFAGRTLILKDTDAQVVVDLLPDTLPELPPPGVPTVVPAPVPGAGSILGLPRLRGAMVFAALGDSGSGDQAQEEVAQAMLTYFKDAARFPFVIMLGDNLYDDDYDGEFSKPYKPLLDAGVKFYAALGNHDRDLEIHFKPFNMGDRDRYTFDEGNARFAVLNSNHPADPAQAKWLDGAYTDAGDKWRIAYFHHPLYSSGQHADESRSVIRPALEPVLQRNHVDVVFSGHEHLYERVAPQNGIRYFVSGGGGRNLYSVHRSDFDEVATSEHHFMVVEIAGDRLFFEAVTPQMKLLDCGLLWRRASQVKADANIDAWVASCESARPHAVTTQQRP
ncbi:MAG TPA: metallophosphoesterase [Vicinamibacterales bacterium]|nr:metallophosphoesterase [Vicinamibacterales bacterium]